MLRLQFKHVRQLDQQIEELDAEVANRLAPFEAQVMPWDTILDVNDRVAEVIVADVGTDMTRFPNTAHLAARAGMCPGNNESAGKHRRARTRKGSPTLRWTLTEAGLAAGRAKTTYLGATFQRIAARRGGNKAAIAVGRRILEIAYQCVTRRRRIRGTLGELLRRAKEGNSSTECGQERLERLGYKVTVEATNADLPNLAASQDLFSEETFSTLRY